ncbi:retinol dehydrogenase 14-like [Argiope bruennichi]|uniref:Retinol dehydrogenase 14 like protein n=1 Tax=Argiope bruennichi TaxID=94029 RepID=A0A8T0G311_ARGBR|nr:retinol dehydrogenase 14-like [Argiope bruennichi]KAF8795643.1 Retinol dehydrogenase 14 like protein [Argiope bruennichi]
MLLKILGTSTALIIGVFIIRKYREYTWGKCKSKRSVKNKTFIITGANSGLGKATALELAKRGARIILACRDQEKGQKALIDIRSKSRSGILKVMELDLASFESIRKFANEFSRSEERLDVLINNAGVFQCPYMTTKEGYEMQFGVNHLGHFLLTKLLLEKLKQSAPSRIVVVSSALYKKGIIDFNTLNSKEHYNKGMAYKNSKLANVLFCRELSKRLEGTGVNVYAVSPGMVWTNLGRHVSVSWWKIVALAPIAWLFIRTPYQGAQTILHCAISEEVESESGLYYRNCEKEAFAKVAEEENLAKKLWEVSEQMITKVEKSE